MPGTSNHCETSERQEKQIMTAAPAIAVKSKGKAWHSQSAEKVLAQLACTADGLSSREAEQRLSINGTNELKEGRRIPGLRNVERRADCPGQLIHSAGPMWTITCESGTNYGNG